MRLDGVGKRYRGGATVLTAVDLQLSAAQVTVVLGSNGSGKSTLLRIVAGVTSATEGRVIRRPKTVGYVPDRFPSHLRMPAASYLRHMAALHRQDAADAARQATELLDDLRFSDDVSTPMALLSKGNAQKIALTQALCSGARLLVLDEPWSGLDVDVAPVVSSRIAAAGADGATILLTDHTGTATTQPRRQQLRLVDGRLTADDRQPPVRPSATMVTVTVATTDPAGLAARLPSGWEHADPGQEPACGATARQLIIRVGADRSDALLRAALDLGGSIQAVQRTPAPAVTSPAAPTTEPGRARPGGDP